MKKFLENLIEKAKAEGAEVHVIHVNAEEPHGEPQGEPEPKDEFADAKEEAQEIAELNKILYEAHIKAGFTSEEALALVTAMIK